MPEIISEHLQKGKVCIHCGVELTDDNWYLSCKRHRMYSCRTCENRRIADYRRRNYISYCRNGKATHIKVKNKRERTNACELCGRGIKLGYHHWDDNDFSKGLWLCYPCHMFAEGMDKKRDVVYLKLKRNLASKEGENLNG